MAHVSPAHSAGERMDAEGQARLQEWLGSIFQPQLGCCDFDKNCQSFPKGLYENWHRNDFIRHKYLCTSFFTAHKATDIIGYHLI